MKQPFHEGPQSQGGGSDVAALTQVEDQSEDVAGLTRLLTGTSNCRPFSLDQGMVRFTLEDLAPLEGVAQLPWVEETTSDSIVGGGLRHVKKKWKLLIQESAVLEITIAYHLEFVCHPRHPKVLLPHRYSNEYLATFRGKVESLLDIGAVVTVTPADSHVVSPIFFRSKSHGSLRPVFNLKGLNQSIRYQHFEMESVPVLNLDSKRRLHGENRDTRCLFLHPDRTGTQEIPVLRLRGKPLHVKVLPFGLVSAPSKYLRKFRNQSCRFSGSQG